MIRNGLKTMAGNFILVWKHLVYILFAFIISGALFAWSAEPIVRLLKSSGWVQELYDFFELIYTSPKFIASGFGRLATDLYLVLFNNFRAVWGNYLLSFILLTILPNLLYYIGEYVLGVLTNAKMSSLHNRSYTYTLLCTLKRSVLYSLFKILLSVPFALIMVALAYMYGVLTNTVTWTWFLFPIFIALELFVLSVKYTFFIGYLPQSVQETEGIAKSFAIGIDEYTDGFFKKVVLVWGLFIMEMATILFVGVFTIGAGLIVVIPGVMVTNVAISLSNYYTTKKENFYVGADTIVKPV